jgi:hypothetical protein
MATNTDSYIDVEPINTSIKTVEPEDTISSLQHTAERIQKAF